VQTDNETPGGETSSGSSNGEKKVDASQQMKDDYDAALQNSLAKKSAEEKGADKKK